MRGVDADGRASCRRGAGMEWRGEMEGMEDGEKGGMESVCRMLSNMSLFPSVVCDVRAALSRGGRACAGWRGSGTRRGNGVERGWKMGGWMERREGMERVCRMLS